ncbi:Flp1 family type IVb pilin [Sinanaerobacter chloroacetimidivorans]|jgi:hypothetical protein|uniref:Flagellin Flp1-like domain-containing protein n=1 Tax=Sinanaerobacter chloroacetimidivorans TaxID=2818044 RepID=A0A8J8B092_9FIRM|nr:Flp1 family type IVb pilin [Sinanaerobacter chloroacetimidivorans]MBR0596366.1 hypothetical protein [Sinanaerobacter chloroacetimidivorans]
MTKKKFIQNNKKGMEMVQVAILVAIAIGLGLIFKDKIGEFISATFDNLMNSGF